MSERALEGIRVLDFSWVLAGPIMTRALAYHGAEVIRVETTRRLDPVLPYFGTNAETHAGKLSIGLDVSRPEGFRLFRRLVQKSDVVVDNYAAGVMERLGLTYAKLSEMHREIIQVTMPAMGSSGPHKNDITFGPNIHAVAGLDHLTGYPDSTPGGLGISYADYAAPGHAMVAILAALEYRDRTGRGQWIDLSQFESLVSLLGPELLAFVVNGDEATRDGNRVVPKAPYSSYPCRGQDQWCVIAVGTDDEWAGLCTAMDRPALALDPRFATLARRLQNQDELDRLVGQWTASRTSYDVMTTLQGHGVPAGMAQDIPQLLQDTHLAAREFLHVDVPDHWYQKVTLGGIQIRLSETPGAVTGPAPYMGEHNDYVFGTLLGLSEAERRELAEQKVIEVTMPDQYQVPPDIRPMLDRQ